MQLATAIWALNSHCNKQMHKIYLCASMLVSFFKAKYQFPELCFYLCNLILVHPQANHFLPMFSLQTIFHQFIIIKVEALAIWGFAHQFMTVGHNWNPNNYFQVVAKHCHPSCASRNLEMKRMQQKNKTVSEFGNDILRPYPSKRDE